MASDTTQGSIQIRDQSEDYNQHLEFCFSAALTQQAFSTRDQLKLSHDTFFFPNKNPLFPHNRFFTHFFSMKVAKLWKNVLVNCIIDFDNIQLCLRQFCLNMNICKVMTIFFKFWPRKVRKTVITLQILRFKPNCLRQS